MTLPNYNGPMRSFIPALLGGPAAGKGVTPLRECNVVDGVASTYVVPGDWPDDIDKWNAPGTHFKPSAKNQVKYFCATSPTQAGGVDTFRAMKEAFATATGPGHFIVLIGWSHNLDFPLDGNSATAPGTGNTMREIWTAKARAGVLLRTLLWRPLGGAADALGAIEEGAIGGPGVLPATVASQNPDPDAWQEQHSLGNQNGPETEFLKTLDVHGSSPRRVIAVWDAHLRDPLGAHHQKILVVYGSEGLIAFFGGIDIHHTRVIPDTDGSPLHDVHCRVQGDAATDLLALCIDRWNACPEAAAQENAAPWSTRATDHGTLSPVGPGAPRQQVQIGQTVGNPSMPYPSDGYPMLLYCIRRAQKFIYMQDQYLWSEDCAKELNKVVPHLEHLTIVVPDPIISDPLAAGMILRRRAVRALIDGLSAQDLQKIGIYSPAKAGDPGTYVHSKVWVFDDECAIIGSSNCNNRGYQHDSEMMGRVSEGNIRLFDDLDLNFAHKLRMMLWHHHLGGFATMESLIDPASVCYFPLQEWSLDVSREADDFGRWEDFTNYDDGGFFRKWVLDHPIRNILAGVNYVVDIRHGYDPRA